MEKEDREWRPTPQRKYQNWKGSLYRWLRYKQHRTRNRTGFCAVEEFILWYKIIGNLLEVFYEKKAELPDYNLEWFIGESSDKVSTWITFNTASRKQSKAWWFVEKNCRMVFKN